MSNEFFPLIVEQTYHGLPLEPLTDDTCVCGHEGVAHLSRGERCCMLVNCKCMKFKRFEKAMLQSEIDQAMVHFHEMEKTIERVRWVFENLKFFRNYDEFDLGIAWGIHILKYNPYEEFMDKDIYTRLKKWGKPASIGRAARRLREECVKKLHPNECKYCPFNPNLIEARIEKEYGLWQYFAENKL